MIKIRNEIYIGAEKRKSLVDLIIPEEYNGHVLIFIHGFMGFKDWGAWNLVQEYFVEKGFGFCKFNISHNGGTVSNGVDFPDPLAFGKNTYSKEIDDLKNIVNWIGDKVPKWNGHLIGHSKGGALAIIAGRTMDKIQSVSTWAAIASIGERFPKGEPLLEWKKEGVRFVKNGRTNQNLPQQFSLFEDFKNNESQYDIKSICEKYKKPMFIAHGRKDHSVHLENGERLAHWTGNTLQIIEGADHVFSSRHPWIEKSMPKCLRHLCEINEAFLFSIMNVHK